MIYFDHNATSPLSPVARDAWLAAAEQFPANPSSPHRLGSRAEAALSEARRSAASLLGCPEFDLVWTSGATEANNALFYHASRNDDGEAWVSAIEHPSVIAAAQRWFPGKVRLLRATGSGMVDLDFFGDHLKRSRPALVAVMAANNETGIHQPWRKALEICRKHDVPFACDASQWIGKEPSAGLGECDFITACAHKFGGPLGIGFLKAPKQFHPLLVGGPQEDGRRAGTENLPGALAMVAAWNERENRISKGESSERSGWRNRFTKQLQKELPEVQVLGSRSACLWNTVAAIMPVAPDCRRRWVVQLDKLGFAVSTGSACASGKQKPSHVLTAMQIPREDADRMLRFSSGWDTAEAEWRHLLDAIVSAATNLTRSAQ